MEKELKITLITIAVATFFLVSLGSFVRATGAGLSCPDWPLCFGRVVPHTFDNGVFQEWAHRGLALIVSLGTVYFAFSVYPQRSSQRKLWRLSIVLLGLLFVQVILGGLTVLMRLNPFIVTSHLLFGTLFFQLCALTALDPKSEGIVALSKIKKGVAAFALLIFVQIIIGGFVGSSGASLVCPDIPLCYDGAFLPKESNGAQHLHMMHRSLGVLIAIVGAFLAIRLGREKDLKSGIKGHCFGLLFLILVQIAVGLLNVYMRIPVSVTVLHLAIGQLLLLGYLVLFRRL